MKTIDIKSLLIGGLLASTILLGMAAVPSDTSTHRGRATAEWDDGQLWEVAQASHELFAAARAPKGYQPFAINTTGRLTTIYYRKRVK